MFFGGNDSIVGTVTSVLEGKGYKSVAVTPLHPRGRKKIKVFIPVGCRQATTTLAQGARGSWKSGTPNCCCVRQTKRLPSRARVG